MTAVVISQPMLFPWPGFFEQMKLADVYVWLDDAQYSKGSFTNRVQIPFGSSRKWLTIPLVSSGSFQPISSISASEEFAGKHLSFLAQAFAGAPYKRDALDVVEEVYSAETLCDLLIASAEIPARILGITPRSILRSSVMNVPGVASQRVLDLTLSVGGTLYITGHGAANYLDHEMFERSGVGVDYMAYSKTPWSQRTAAFTPYVSVLDLIANEGPDAARFLRPATTSWRDFLTSRDAQGEAR